MAENQVYLIKSGSNSFVEETEAIIGISGGRLGVGTTTPEADLHVTGSVKIGGDLAVDGTFTTINSNTISVDDKNIELGSTDNPTDVTADGGGITVKGASDKTFNWSGNNSAWTSSEHLYLANGKHFSADELRALDSDGLKLVDQTTSGVLIKGGKVGIHQAAPVYDLDVDGSGNFTSLYVGGNAVLTGEGSIFGKWEDGATPGEIFYTGGNVGVGTNKPEYPLHVFGNAAVDGNFIVNGESGNLNVSNFNVSGDSIVLNYLGNNLASNRGGLIVKDSSDASKSLEYIEGSDFWLSSESVRIADGKELQTDKVRAIDAGGLSLQDDGGNGIFIEDGGQVGINTSNPNYNLDVNGSAKIGSDFYAGSAFKVSAAGAVGDIAPASDGDIIKWDDANNKWVAGANVGGGGGGGVGEVPLATINSLSSGQSIYQIDFAETYNVEPRIATQLEIDGEGSIIPYVVSGVSTSGYHLIFAQDIPNNNYRIHTTFGGRDVHWETGSSASLYYNDGDVSIQRNFTVGGNLTVNGTTTTVNTETVEIEDHNLVIAANTGYNQLTSQYPGAGGAYAGVLWGTGDAGSASPVRLTYQTNKGFAFEGGNVGIGTTDPRETLTVAKQSDPSLLISNYGSTAGTSSILFGDSSSDEPGRIIYEHTNNSLDFYTNQTQRVTIDSVGNVGIGTTNPGSKLEVFEDLNTNDIGDSILTVTNTRLNTGSGSATIGFVTDEVDGSTADKRAQISASYDGTNGGKMVLSTHNGTSLKQALTIKNDGSVGIGTTVPGGSLHVNTVSKALSGTVSVTADTTAVTGSGTSFSTELNTGDRIKIGSQILTVQSITDDTTLTLSANHTAGASGVTAYTDNNGLIVTSAGNVGIGATNPSAKLHISGDDGFTALTINDNSQNADMFSIICAEYVSSEPYNMNRFRAGNSSGISFESGGEERMRIESSGNIGIGATNPDVNLHIEVAGGSIDSGNNRPGAVLRLTHNAGWNSAYGSGGSNPDFLGGVEFETTDPSGGTGVRTAIKTTVDHYANDNSLAFYTAPKETAGILERMRIDSAGNVGIGTTNPQFKTSIVHGADENDEIVLALSANDSSMSVGQEVALGFGQMDYVFSKISSYYESNNGFGLKFYTGTGTTGRDRTKDYPSLTIDSYGNVGIGTTNPTHHLNIVTSSTSSGNSFKVENTRTSYGYGSPMVYFQQSGDSGLSNSVGLFGVGNYDDSSELGNLFRITQSGNVGIGTTNPSKQLHIEGASASVPGIKISASDQNYEHDIRANGDGILISADSTNYGGSGPDIRFNVSGTEHMRIRKGGNVGIGTTVPGGSLHVNTVSKALSGTVSVTADTTAVTGSGTSFSTELNTGDRIKIGSQILTVQSITDDTTLTLSANHTAGASGVTAYTDNNGLIVTSAGNVGIGTTSPTAPLDVQNDVSGFNVDGHIVIQNSPGAQDGDYQGIGFSCHGNTGDGNIKNWFGTVHADTYGRSDFVFLASNDVNNNAANQTHEVLRITRAGNVGIGTTNPGTKLHIDGGGTANSKYAFSVYGSSSAASKPSVMAGFDNGTTSYTMVLGKGSRANGYLLGAFSSSNTFCFQMLDSGNLQNTNNSYGQLSDIKLKENVVNATPKLDDLNKVRVVNFNFKGDDLKQIGVVAQELEEIFPGLVDDVPDHDEDGNLLGTTTKSVKYSIFGPILIKAIQEQQQIIEQLQSQNASLESRISALES